MEGKEQEPTIEELINKIVFLKQALEFYGDQDNYKSDAIRFDDGHQARFALKQIIDIDKYNQEMLDASLEKIQEYKEEKINPESLGDDYQSKINEINNIIKKYSNPDE